MKKTLKEWREEKGLTQADMAKELGIVVSSYNMYETGQRAVPFDKAKKIAEILNAGMDDIFLPQKFTVSKRV